MKKLFSFFKLAGVAALLWAAAPSANAQVANGTYNFTSTLTDVDASIQEYISADFSFVVSNTNNWNSKVEGFIWSDFSDNVSNNGSNGLEFDEWLMRTVYGAPANVAFANADGDYPELYYDSTTESTAGSAYSLTITFNEDGTVTVPDFTLVSLDDTNHTTTILARYSNCSAYDPSKVVVPTTPPSLEQLAGEYRFTSTLSDVDADYEGYFAAEFDFKAEYLASNIQFQQFINAGYEQFIKSYDAETGTITFNHYISEDYDRFVALAFANANGDCPDEYWDDAIDGYTEEFNLTAVIDGNGKITFPDFTVVEVELWAFGKPEMKVCAKFTNATAVKTDGFQDVVTVDIPGEYTITGTRTDYTSGTAVSYEGAKFILKVGPQGELMAIAGYGNDDLDVFYEEGYNTGWIEGTFWTLPAYNSKGAAYLERPGHNGATRTVVLSGPSTTSYNESAEITLSYNVNDETWTLSDFTIWSQSTQTVPGTEDSDASYNTVSTLLYAWTNMTAVKGAEDLTEPVSPVGTHTFVDWYKTDYTGEEPVTTQENLTLTINDSYQLAALAEYTVPAEAIEYYYNTGAFTPELNVWTIETTSFVVLDFDFANHSGAGVFLSGPNDLEAWNNEAEIVLSYNDETEAWELTDFTIWAKVITSAGGETDEEGNTSSETTTSWKLLTKWASTGTVTDGINGVAVDENAPVEFFNLQGIRVTEPAAGNIYIRRQGNTATKVLIK